MSDPLDKVAELFGLVTTPPKVSRPKRLTFAVARENLRALLLQKGWQPSNPHTVKVVPYLTSPQGHVRVWFKPQALYVSTADRHNPHTLKDASSFYSDIRDITPEKALAALEHLVSQARSLHGAF